MITEKICEVCNLNFQIKKLGFNAKYCSKKCKNKAAKLRLSPETKAAQRSRRYLRIKDNPDEYAKSLSINKQHKRNVREWLANYKLEHSCIDCGYNKHFSALQLDHQGKKTAEISLIRSSKERLLKEINSGECVVRCAVCHSVKTWAEKNHIKYEPSMARDFTIKKDEQNMTTLFEELNDMMRLYRKRIEDEGEQALKDRFREFFQTHPGVKSVQWTQYTPYFNDGESCVFSVNDFSVSYRPEQEPDEEPSSEEDEDFEEDDEEDDWERSAYSLSRSPDPALKLLGEELGKLSDIPEDVLEAIFGDHVKVKATRAGFQVTEYQHD